MSREEQLAYARGYTRGRKTGFQEGQKWPPGFTPTPDDPALAELIRTAKELRDECDDRFAQGYFTGEPEESRFDALIDAIDNAMAGMDLEVKRRQREHDQGGAS